MSDDQYTSPYNRDPTGSWTPDRFSLNSILPRNIRDALLNKDTDKSEPTEHPALWGVYDKTVEPMVHTFTSEAKRILNTWTKDPIVLCCLIRNLAVIGKVDDEIRKGGKKGVSYLRYLLIVLDIMINFFRKDLNLRADDSIDFLRFLSMSVIGAIITTLDNLRLEVMNRLSRVINNLSAGNRSIIRRCLPLEELITLLLKVLQDPINGLLSRATNLIKEWERAWKAEIHIGYNCGELIRGQEQIQSLSRQRENILEQIQRVRNTTQGREIETDLDNSIKKIDTQIKAIESKIVLNKGVPLLGKSGCFLQKIEFLQKLLFFRHIVLKVMQGLERGILCASLTPDMLLITPDPLREQGLGQFQPTPFPNPPDIPYPSDSEIERFLKDVMNLNEETTANTMDRLKAADDPNRVSGGGVNVNDIISDIAFIESVASCTEVLNDDITFEFAESLRRLETTT